MSEQSPAPRALDPAKTAAMLDICRASVYNMINRGELKAVKIGRSTRIPVSEIDRVLGGGVS